MRSDRSRATYVKAKDIEPGMVIRTRSINGAGADKTVLKVQRAADMIAEAQAAIGKIKSRPKLRAAVDDLYDALSAIEDEGREARMILYEGNRRSIPFGSQEELRYIGQRTVT